jgi:hypothetical protein
VESVTLVKRDEVVDGGDKVGLSGSSERQDRTDTDELVEDQDEKRERRSSGRASIGRGGRAGRSGAVVGVGGKARVGGGGGAAAGNTNPNFSSRSIGFEERGSECSMVYALRDGRKCVPWRSLWEVCRWGRGWRTSTPATEATTR